MTQAQRKSQHGVLLREDSGVLSAGETVTPGLDLDGYRRAVIHLRQTANLITPDADDEVHFLFDPAYGDPTGGAAPRWVNVAHIRYVTGDDDTAPEAVIHIGSEPDANALTDDVQGDAAVDTIRANVPLGDRLRIRVTVAGATAPSYRYECFGSFLGG